MSDVCYQADQLQSRDGVSQSQRTPLALDPSALKLDGRTLEDLVMWAARFAQWVVHSRQNEDETTWQSFFADDPTFLAARIATTEGPTLLLRLEAHIASALEPIEHQTSRATRFRDLCKAAIDLAARFERWRRLAPSDLTQRRELDAEVEHSVAPLVRDLCALVEEVTDKVSGFDAGEIDWSAACSTWLETPTNREERLPAADEPNDVLERAVGIAARLVERLAEILARTVNRAPRWLEQSLHNWPRHEPHVALFLAFLGLFERVQSLLDGIVGRHLSFYYDEVLRIPHRRAIPDSAHVVFELGRQCHALLLEAGTRLSAGKDATGKERVYALDRDLALNRGRVADVRAVMRDGSADAGVFRVSSFASSGGKRGEPTPNATMLRWSTFGQSQTPAEYDAAPVGLAIVSPLLFLEGGQRTVHIRATFESNGEGSWPAEGQDWKFRARYTGPEGWEEGEQPVSFGSESDESPWLTCDFEIGRAQPPVTKPVQALHGRSGPWPVLELRPTIATAYDSLTSMRLANLSLWVEVEDVADLVLENELGSLNPAKPFLPFGPAPLVGAAFHIGSTEAFRKPLEEVSVAFTDASQGNRKWETGCEDNDSKWLQVATSIVQDRYQRDAGDVAPAQEIGHPSYLWRVAVDDQSETQSSENGIPISQRHSQGLCQGFLQLKLTSSDLKNDSYVADFTKDVFDFTKNLAKIAAGDGGTETWDTVTPPQLQAPVTPRLTDFRLGYSTRESPVFSANNDGQATWGHLHHILPFGRSGKLSAIDDGVTLLPICPARSTAVDGISQPMSRPEGALYLGIADFEPPGSLTLLIQVVEGSSGPERADLEWSVLTGDDWQPLRPQEVPVDTTIGLLQSGIIEFVVPAKSALPHTRMPSELLWLRLAVVGEGGICDLVDVQAQAAPVTSCVADPTASQDEMPLQAGSISKLVPRRASVRKVQQPFAGFGGRAAETDHDYSRRVAERIRHRDRAITPWDYERLVLEKFPEVHKVKCVPHWDGTSSAAPGKVTVVVVGDIRNRNIIEPLRPRVSAGTRARIHEFLKARMSLAACGGLSVRDPRFETVQVNASVRLRPPASDAGLFASRLNDELVRFLSPWAFDGGLDIPFDGRIYPSTVVYFIEERPYVDGVANFTLIHDPTGLSGHEVVEARPSTPCSILVSANSHALNVEPCLEDAETKYA